MRSFNSLAHFFTRALPRAARTLNARRKGSVIIFILAALAVMGITAVTYVTVVQRDRASTTSYQRTTNFQQQVRTVVDSIRALLTADLYGNKLVTNATPRTVTTNSNNVVNVWPHMFEDGEFFDLPQTHTQSFNNNDLDSTVIPEGARLSRLPLDDPTFDANGDRTRIAYQDDAWLASTEGFTLSGNTEIRWDTTRQLTNLRSAYHFIDTDNDGDPDTWVRDNGRYVDLGQFFIQALTNIADPAALLTDANPRDMLLTSSLAFNNRISLHPHLALFQPTYAAQMREIDEDVDLDPTYQRFDERLFADTNGDGFPDARWQELDALGSLFGMRWVVAANIIDNSTLINVNTATSLGYPFAPTASAFVGDGRTPADVDLFRFLRFRANTSNSLSKHPNVDAAAFDFLRAIDNKGGGYFKHLTEGVAVEKILDQLDPNRNGLQFVSGQQRIVPRLDKLFNMSGRGLNLEEWITARNLHDETPALNRSYKEAIYMYFGSNPHTPVASRGVGYPLSEEIDLRAYHGFNYERQLSRIEQYFDGPEDTKFLPGLGGDTDIGVMRSKATTTDSNWRIQNVPLSQFRTKEKVERIMRDARRSLTTYSGYADYSPVPNYSSSDPSRRIRIDDFATNSNKPKLLNRAFGALTWALAPLATDIPLQRGISLIDLTNVANTGQSGANKDFHYGGGPTGPAQAIEIETTVPMGASYALLRAASIATNLADAVDHDVVNPDSSSIITQPAPTIVRVFPSNNVVDNPKTRDVIEMGVSFDHGDIDNTPNDDNDDASADLDAAGLLPKEYFGTIDGSNTTGAPNTDTANSRGGITLVGLDRQPFLRGAYTLAAYRDLAVTNTISGDINFDVDMDGSPDPPYDGEINPYNRDEQLLSIFAVELGNPWADRISLNNYHVRFGVEPQLYLDFAFPDNAGIDAGARAVFYVVKKTTIGDDTRTLEADLLFEDWIGRINSLESPVDTSGANTLTLDAAPGFSVDNPVEDEGPEVSFIFFDELLHGFNPPAVEGGALDNDDPVNTHSSVSLHYVSPSLAAGDPNDAQPIPPVLVDRMRFHTDGEAPTSSLEDTFPTGLTSTNFLDIAGGGVTEIATGYLAVSSTIDRATQTGPRGGFPAYVIEFDINLLGAPTAMDARTTLQSEYQALDTDPEADEFDYVWNVNDAGVTQTVDINVSLPSLLDSIGNPDFYFAEEQKDGPNTNLENLVGALGIPSFELFVPDTPLAYLSELHQICAFTHMCIDNELNNPDKWTTISEQLGSAENLYYNPVDRIGANPYLGLLDPTRYIPGSRSLNGDLEDLDAPALLPDTLRVPLATRVFDPFLALNVPGALVQGAVNINHASHEVLSSLPFVNPQFEIGSLEATALSPQSRATLIQDYRDTPPAGANFALGSPESLTSLPGLRNRPNQMPYDPWELINNPTNNDPPPTVNGLAAIGELAIMDSWSTSIPGNPEPNSVGFAALGSNNSFDPMEQQAPLDMRNSQPNTGHGVEALDNVGVDVANYDASDDPEERLALFRAISNIASTRSDVFTAYFVLRGYDPAAIESVLVGPGAVDNDRMRDLFAPSTPNKAGLGDPAFEQRWLVVFDRSNIKSPTDRPRVLMMVELPFEKPSG